MNVTVFMIITRSERDLHANSKRVTFVFKLDTGQEWFILELEIKPDFFLLLLSPCIYKWFAQYIFDRDIYTIQEVSN